MDGGVRRDEGGSAEGVSKVDVGRSIEEWREKYGEMEGEV